MFVWHLLLFCGNRLFGTAPPEASFTLLPPHPRNEAKFMIATPLLIEMPSDSFFLSQMPFTDLKIIEVEKVFYRRMISAFYLSDRGERERVELSWVSERTARIKMMETSGASFGGVEGRNMKGFARPTGNLPFPPPHPHHHAFAKSENIL